MLFVYECNMHSGITEIFHDFNRQIIVTFCIPKNDANINGTMSALLYAAKLLIFPA